MTLISPANILSFTPKIDGNWAKENTDIDITKPIKLIGRSDEIIIEDIDKNDKYSLMQLEERLGNTEDENYGELTNYEKFTNAFLCFDENKYKLSSYKLTYRKARPMNVPVNIDYFKQLVGVIEYLQKGSKTAIFKDNIIKDW